MEEEFARLQYEITRSEVTWERNIKGVNQLHYNECSKPMDFYNLMNKFVTPFIAHLYQTHNHPVSQQLDIYNPLFRRLHSLKPFFILNEAGNVIGHHNLIFPSSPSKEAINKFILPFLAIQFNTFEKIETELGIKIDFLKSASVQSTEAGKPNADVTTAGSNYQTTYPHKSFRFRNDSKIREFFEILLRHKYIVDRDFLTFERNFSGSPVRGKIKWASSMERLNYIIKLLKENNVIEDFKRQKNFLIQKCFTDRNGNDFIIEQFSAIHTPNDADNIDVQFSNLWNIE